jgi:hypothetical protein
LVATEEEDPVVLNESLIAISSELGIGKLIEAFGPLSLCELALALAGAIFLPFQSPARCVT